jgi:ATP-binding cassette subfamily F protein uup
MAPPLLHLQNIEASIGSVPLLRGANLSVGAGERVCLVGRNGSGKSTFLRIATGELAPSGGTRFLQPGSTIRSLPQEPDLSGYASIGAYVLQGLGPADDPERARRLLADFGLDPDRVPVNLSGGETRRAALVRVLAPAPDILLLDEPTNHLDLPAIEFLESYLAGMRNTALVLISHDRRFLEKLSKTVVWLDRGRTREMQRGFAEFEAWRDEVLAQEEVDAQKLARQVVREEDWLRYGVTARRKRNVKRLAGLHALRAEHRNREKPVGMASFNAEISTTGGKLVAVAEDIFKTFGDKCVVRDFSTRIIRGDRVGIIGPNGAGKTTLLKMLTGSLLPDEGRVAIGTSLRMVTLDQMRDQLDPQKTLAATLTLDGGDYVEVGDERRHVIGYMKDFLFKPEQARTPVGVLSGGERGRLLLAVALAKKSNLMVLDEPTNDLDLETLDLLQEMLADYPGTVILVSHDRDFLDRVVTSTIASDGDGRWIEYAGGYSDMVIQRGKARAEEKRATGKGNKSGETGRAAPLLKKMSFKDKHALETLPAEMAKLTARIEAHQAVLGDAALFSKNLKKWNMAMAALAADQAALTAAEERWLALEMMRLEIEVR